MDEVEFFQMLEEAASVNKLVKSVVANAEKTVADGREGLSSITFLFHSPKEIRKQKEVSRQFKPFLGQKQKKRTTQGSEIEGIPDNTDKQTTDGDPSQRVEQPQGSSLK